MSISSIPSPSPISVKEAVHKLMLSLFDGISREPQLMAAGSILSKSDYQDVAIERSLAKLCGYPLCSNALQSDASGRRGRYRISLKEHKVYDLEETRMYCSSGCLVNSRAFAGSLEDERVSELDSAKVDRVLRLFGELGVEEEKGGLGKNGDLGFGKLTIQEKAGSVAGEVAVADWIGPSNAIEGYVRQSDRSKSPSRSKHRDKDSKLKPPHSDGEGCLVDNEAGFTSDIIISDQSSTLKASPSQKKKTSDTRSEKLQGKVSSEKTTNSTKTQLKSTSKLSGENATTDTVITSTAIVRDQVGSSKASSASQKNSLDSRAKKAQEVSIKKTAESGEAQLKSALKSSGVKTLKRNVTWADEKHIDDSSGRDLCNIKEIEDKSGNLKSSGISEVEDDRSSQRYASAEACAIALAQAAEAVESGQSDGSDAVDEAGIIILPSPKEVDEGKSPEDVDMLESKHPHVKWPRKPVLLDSDVLESEDSWHDTPPEGFSLTLSSFATMWMALFGWISASSVAYIYGHDEGSQDEFLSVDGREYPLKIVLGDGRSAEIKQTLAGCLARALPGLVTNLRLPTPISTIERAMGHLLDTMSFVDALPPFRTKQWHVVLLLFLDALSVRRIPSLAQHMASKNMLLNKVLDAAQVSKEEYDAMKDLLIPLGRLPEFSVQSGG